MHPGSKRLEIICWEGQNVQRIEVVAPKEEEEEEEEVIFSKNFVKFRM
jgi:hypothetical protein